MPLRLRQVMLVTATDRLEQASGPQGKQRMGFHGRDHVKIGILNIQPRGVQQLQPRGVRDVPRRVLGGLLGSGFKV